MGHFKIWMLVLGIGIVIISWKEWRLSGAVKQEAQTITCTDLALGGYGDNAHIRLTDFYVATAEFVTQEKRRSKAWSKVWLPVVPMDGEYVKLLGALPDDAEEIPPVRDFRVILQSEHVEGQAGLARLGELDALTGVVINEVDSLDSDTKKLLGESYPGVDLDTCWILDHRRKVPAAARYLAVLALGVGLVAWAILLFVRGRKKA